MDLPEPEAEDSAQPSSTFGLPRGLVVVLAVLLLIVIALGAFRLF